ncbi:MAG: 50S ribosomal protein L3 [Candidatus Colwellbacteria bacterium]|nr:50S ribosomal protein L3 [Candidatus Colwellbacteria bacterium]
MNYTEGKKKKMGQIFREEEVVPVTFIELDADEDVEFVAGEKLRIVAKSRGRGFQGVVKRHGFHGGPKTHGQKHTHRASGSIGATGPQRVLPGTRMAGRMGSVKVNLKSVEVVAFEKLRRLLVVKGPVPGMKGNCVKIFKK